MTPEQVARARMVAVTEVARLVRRGVFPADWFEDGVQEALTEIVEELNARGDVLNRFFGVVARRACFALLRKSKRDHRRAEAYESDPTIERRAMPRDDEVNDALALATIERAWRAHHAKRRGRPSKVGRVTPQAGAQRKIRFTDFGRRFVTRATRVEDAH